MHLSRYRPVERAFQEHLRYVLHDGNGVIRIKPDGYLVGYELRGPDALSASWSELTYHADAVARVLATLDDSWTIHVSAHHRRAGTYPSSGSWPHPMVHFLDRVRRARYECDGEHFTMATRLWLAWQPPTTRRRFTSWVFGEERGNDDERAAFHHAITNIEGSLHPLFTSFERIDFDTVHLQGHTVIVDRIAQRLGEELYGSFGLIAADPEEPVFLSHLLSSPVTLRPDLFLGNRYVGVTAVRGYPRLLFPAMLDCLRYLPIEFRYVVRIMPYSMPQASEQLTQVSRQHLLATLGLGLFLNRGGHAEEEATPALWRHQVREARIAAQAGEAFCSVLPQIVVYAQSPQERDEALRAIGVALEQRGIQAKAETQVNRFHAYLASLPGECDANEVRYARASLRGAARLCALTSTWHGPEHHPDPRFRDEDMPLTMVSTAAREPFRLFLHVGGVGHTLIVGRTGRGKSVLLRALENAHLSRYRGARVVAFDIGRSAYKYAKAIEGHHSTLRLGEGPRIAPLLGLDNPMQFDDLFSWLITFTEVWSGRACNVKELEDMRYALQGVREAIPARDRRLSDLGRLVQTPELRSIFEQARGSLLDAAHDAFAFADDGVPYWCFEIGELGLDNPRWTVPTILALQRRALAEFARGDSTPTLVTVDEGARALKIPKMQDFAERIQREGRKNRVQFTFATQGVGEIVRSPIRDVLIEQTVTKIAMANRDANGDVIRREYLEVGFSPDDVETIATMGEYDILIRNEYGVQVVRLDPGAAELSIYGGAGNEDCEIVDAYIRRFGAGAWVDPYLTDNGRPLEDHPNEAPYALAAPLPDNSPALAESVPC